MEEGKEDHRCKGLGSQSPEVKEGAEPAAGIMVESLGFGVRLTWVQVLVLPFTNSEMLHPSASQFLHL